VSDLFSLDLEGQIYPQGWRRGLRALGGMTVENFHIIRGKLPRFKFRWNTDAEKNPGCQG
jgi:hypothetical protein